MTLEAVRPHYTHFNGNNTKKYICMPLFLLSVAKGLKYMIRSAEQNQL